MRKITKLLAASTSATNLRIAELTPVFSIDLDFKENQRGVNLRRQEWLADASVDALHELLSDYSYF